MNYCWLDRGGVRAWHFGDLDDLLGPCEKDRIDRLALKWAGSKLVFGPTISRFRPCLVIKCYPLGTTTSPVAVGLDGVDFLEGLAHHFFAPKSFSPQAGFLPSGYMTTRPANGGMRTFLLPS
jgi:hypothetical protein